MLSTSNFPSPPKKVKRCKADQWRVDRDLKVSKMASAINVKTPDLRRALLPTDHPDWRKASLSIREKVKAYTGGFVTLDDWPTAATLPPRPRAPSSADATAPSAISPVSADGALSSKGHHI